ncbi:MAG: outer membrane lipoprotein-sorting protein, partial [Pseudomonadota bacterium]
MRVSRSLIAVLMGLAVVAGPALAASDEKGFEIAARSARSDRGFGDSTSTMTMTLRNSAGAESTREMRQM